MYICELLQRYTMGVMGAGGGGLPWVLPSSGPHLLGIQTRFNWKISTRNISLHEAESMDKYCN